MTEGVTTAKYEALELGVDRKGLGQAQNRAVDRGQGMLRAMPQEALNGSQGVFDPEGSQLGRRFELRVEKV